MIEETVKEFHAHEQAVGAAVQAMEACKARGDDLDRQRMILERAVDDLERDNDPVQSIAHEAYDGAKVSADAGRPLR